MVINDERFNWLDLVLVLIAMFDGRTCLAFQLISSRSANELSNDLTHVAQIISERAKYQVDMDVANWKSLNIKRKVIVYDRNHDHRVPADVAVKCQEAFEVSANNF